MLKGKRIFQHLPLLLFRHFTEIQPVWKQLEAPSLLLVMSVWKVGDECLESHVAGKDLGMVLNNTWTWAISVPRWPRQPAAFRLILIIVWPVGALKIRRTGMLAIFPLLLDLECAGLTGTPLQPYIVEPRASKVVEARRESLEDYLKSTKGCSSGKAAWLASQLRCLVTNAKAQATNLSSWKPMTLLPFLKLCGMNPVSGVWLLMATGCSEETEKEVEAEGLLFTARSG